MWSGWSIPSYIHNIPDIGLLLEPNFIIIIWQFLKWPSGHKRDCYARGLGFDSRVEESVILFFYEILSSSSELGFKSD